MKFVTYITAVAALVFGLNTSNAATIENSNVVIEAAGGSIDARMDRQGETISVSLKSEELQRALIQLTDSRGVMVYENIVMVDTNGASIDIDVTQIEAGVLTLLVKGKSLQYQKRFKNK